MTRKAIVRFVFLASITSAALGVAVVGQQPGQQPAQPPGQQAAPAPVYTAAQAAAGRAAYDANCAACHLPDLAGRNEAPQLAGANFVNTFGTRTVADLFNYLRTSMPPAGAKLLDDQYLAITAYLLQANGAVAGAQPVTAATVTPIGSIAARQPSQFAVLPGQAMPAIRNDPPGRGLVERGEVPNYTPVTDAMLRNPPAGDWLMIRRNYQAWSHSPLADVTPATVGRLRLQWVWAMAEGGTSQPAPLVHDGILYLINTGNIVQAIDARAQLRRGASRRAVLP